MRKNISKRDYYKNLIQEHKSDLAKARRLISTLMDKLQQEMESVEAGYLRIVQEKLSDDEQPKVKSKFSRNISQTEVRFWWGEKESAASILTKLTALLLKLIPLELDIARTDLSKADLAELEDITTKNKLGDDDLAILELYSERILNNKP